MTLIQKYQQFHEGKIKISRSWKSCNDDALLMPNCINHTASSRKLKNSKCKNASRTNENLIIFSQNSDAYSSDEEFSSGPKQTGSHYPKTGSRSLNTSSHDSNSALPNALTGSSTSSSDRGPSGIENGLIGAEAGDVVDQWGSTVELQTAPLSPASTSFEDARSGTGDTASISSDDSDSYVQRDPAAVSISNIISGGRTRLSRNVGLAAVTTSVKDALNSSEKDSWMAAVRSEYDSLIQNGTWELSPRPKNRRILRNHWVLNKKLNTDGTLNRYKARLVVNGNHQIEGLDYNETFSPTLRYQSLRFLLSLATTLDYEVYQLDIKTAFLINGRLEETIYMMQPTLFPVQVGPQGEDMVLLLKRSLYGLRQAPRVFNAHLHKNLVTLGYTASLVDPAVYTKLLNGRMSYLSVYVDDILVFYPKESQEGPWVLKELSKTYSISDIGICKSILNIDWFRDTYKKESYMVQTQYMKNMLVKFNMEDCKPSPTPMDPTSINQLRDGSIALDPEAHKKYQEAVGTLIHLMVSTRPDIAFSVGVVSRYMSKPTEFHWTLVKRIFRYIQGSLNVGIKLSGNTEITGYCDADWAANVETRRSNTAYVFRVGLSPISWCSKAQKTVALSSAESEYMASSAACQEATSLMNFAKDLKLKVNMIELYQDSQSAMALAHNPVHHARTKHIDVRLHYIRDKVADGSIKLTYCPTFDMVADILTKPLPKPQFLRLRELMGVVVVEGSVGTSVSTSSKIETKAYSMNGVRNPQACMSGDTHGGV
jgi:hypothetical protein